MRRAVSFAAILLLSAATPASEAICLAECEAAAARISSDLPPNAASCHESSRESSSQEDAPWPADCSRHSPDCSIAAGAPGISVSAPRPVPRLFAAEVPTRLVSGLAIEPPGLVPARARPSGALSPAPLSSVRRL